MKKFKDLVKGDLVYILYYGKGSSKTVLRKATFDYSTISEISNIKTTLNIIFKENSETPICAESDRTVHINPITARSSNWLFYFSDIRALEIFIKEEVQELTQAINVLEEIYEEAWSKPTTKAGIYIEAVSQKPVVYDGASTILFSDGSKFIDVYSEKTMSKAKTLEVQRFLIECTETVNKGNENKTILLEVLKKSGYVWAECIKTFIHEIG